MSDFSIDSQTASADSAKSQPKNNLIRDAILYYCGGWIVLLVVPTLVSWASNGAASVSTLFILIYLAVGFVLNRKVLRQLEWHPVYDTLQNVSSAKWWSFLLWPLSYLYLIFRLLVVRFL